jgi:hypothetical protein
LGCAQIQLEGISENLTPILEHNKKLSASLDYSIEKPLDEKTQIEEVVVKPPAIVKPLNLSFDEPMIGNQPTGWFNSFGFVDYVSLGYNAKIVPCPDERHGLCVLFQNPYATQDEFGSLMQRIPAIPFAGKVLRLEGEVRTEKIKKWAGLWMRADGKEISNLFFDNMHDRPIVGTTSWVKYKIDAPLPKDVAWLNYGIVLAGQGKMWADNFRLLIWDNGIWKDL